MQHKKMKTIKDLIEDKRGSIVNVWVTALIMIFSIITIYALTYTMVCVSIYNIAVSMAPVNTEAGYFNVLKLVRMTYNIVPWVLIFGVLLWAYLSSQRREYETGY